MAKRLALGFLLVIYLVVAVVTLQAPGAVPATAPEGEFSSERAMEHVTAVAREPHPMGSVSDEAVGVYIAGQLADMGLAWEVQETSVPDYFGTAGAGGQVQIRNIIAKIPGTDSTGAIALAGHYDSVPASPGANDDGSAVATLLETARALLAGPPLHNDVVLVFTDAEEPGSFRYGARHFVAYHRWVSDIRLVLNFEALGYTGPSVMFETGSGNRWLIDGLSRAAPRPVAFSFVNDLFGAAGKGGTDFIAFEEAGINGMGFAYLYGRTVYHTALDNANSVDQRSLQHHGSYALNLTRYFGNIDLGTSATDSTDSTYFTFFGRYLLHYPASWNFILAALAGVMLVGVVTLGLKRKQLTLSRLLVSSAVFVVELIVISVLLTLAWWGIDELHLRSGIVVEPGVKVHLYFAAFLVLSLVMVEATSALVLRRAGGIARAAGPLMCWWLFATLATVYAPGFGTLFTWPLLFSLPVVGWMLWSDSYGRDSWRNVVSLGASALPGIVMMSIPVYLLFQAFGVSSPGFSGSPSFPIVGLSIFPWVMMLGLLQPHLSLIGANRRKRVISALTILALVCLLVGSVLPGINLDSFGLVITPTSVNAG